MGVRIFNAQFLQTPVPETGNALNRNWLKYYDSTPVVQQDDHVVQSWDTAMKTGIANDYSVCETFLIRNKNEYYLRDVFRKRLEFQDLLKVVLPHAQKFQARTVLIELGLCQAIREFRNIPGVSEQVRSGHPATK